MAGGTGAAIRPNTLLAGLRFTPASGLHVVPSLPKELGAYSYESPLASIAFDGLVTFSGHYQAGSGLGC